MEFVNKNNIKLFHFGIAGNKVVYINNWIVFNYNKEPFVDIPPNVIRDALVQLLGNFNYNYIVN